MQHLDRIPLYHPSLRRGQHRHLRNLRPTIPQKSPLLALPNELLLQILHLVIASESSTTHLTTPHPHHKCTCIPILPSPAVPPSEKDPWLIRLYLSLRKPWYQHCLDLCNRLESWADDPSLPHLYPPGRVLNLAVMRTCRDLYPLAVETFYALNTLTLTSSEVEVMLCRAPRVLRKLTGLRVVERKVEESIWVQEVRLREGILRERRAVWVGGCCGAVTMINAEVLWILLNGAKLSSLTIDLEPFMMCPKRDPEGEWTQHVGSPLRCLQAFGIAWGCHVTSEGIGKYSVELNEELQPPRTRSERATHKARWCARLEGCKNPRQHKMRWRDIPKGGWGHGWEMHACCVLALPLHKLTLSHRLLLDTWTAVSTTPKPLLRQYANQWTPTYLRSDDCPWYPKTPLCRITRDLLFAEMASVLSEVHQQYVKNGGGAARLVASHFLTEILKIDGTAELAAKMIQSKCLPGADARWNHMWTEAFALLVIGSRFGAEKAVHWQARK